MELTNASPGGIVEVARLDAFGEQTYNDSRDVGHADTSVHPDVTNNITRGVPSLATLLNEDEEDERMVQDHIQLASMPAISAGRDRMQASGTTNGAQEVLDGGSTRMFEPPVAGPSQAGQLISFSPGGCEAFSADNLERDRTLLEEQAHLRSTDTFSAERPATDVQVWGSPSLPGNGVPDLGALRLGHKWGHINPGEDDTSDLNLVEKGRAMMGEMTFNQIYGGNETTGEFGRAVLPSSPSQDELNTGSLLDFQGDAEPDLHEGQHSIASLHNYLQDNPQTEGFTDDFEMEQSHRRLSSASALNDLTGKLLEDDLSAELNFAPLGSRPMAARSPTYPQHTKPAIVFTGGRDATTGLLHDEEAEAAAGPLGRLARRLPELHGTSQQPVKAPVLSLLKPSHQSSTTQLLMGTSHLPSGATTRLLDDTQQGLENTGEILAASPATLVHPACPASPDGTFVPDSHAVGSIPPTVVSSGAGVSAGSSVSPPAVQSVLRAPPKPMDARVPVALLVDESLEGLPTPPELPESPGSPQLLVDPEGPTTWVPLSTPRRNRPTPQVIPGGPLIGRTPPPIPPSTGRPGRSSVHRLGATPVHRLGATPVHRFGATPMPTRFHASPAQPSGSSSLFMASAAPSSRHSPTYSCGLQAIPEYPAPQSIGFPGGPKLARTPPQAQKYPAKTGLTPAMRLSILTEQRSPQVPITHSSQASIVAHTPRFELPGHFPRGAKLLRTPIHPVQPTLLAATPMPTPTLTSSGPPPITFQDFLKEVDLQFLDHMRRGTSINFADLASDPPPANLEDSYRLLFVTAPAVAAYESAIGTLNEEIRERKSRIVEKEANLARDNPPIFQNVQMANAAELEEYKEGVAALKKLCRQRTLATWKAWRSDMEADKAESLQEHLQMIQGEQHLLNVEAEKLSSVSQRIATLVSCVHQRFAEEDRLKKAAAAMRSQVEEQESLNHKRRQFLQKLESETAQLRAKLEDVGKHRAEMEQVQSESHEQAATPGTVQASTLEDLHTEVDTLDILSSCTSWQIEHVRVTSKDGELVLRHGPFFRLNVFVGSGSETGMPQAQGYLELTRPEEAPHISQNWRDMVADLSGSLGPSNRSGTHSAKFHLNLASIPKLAAVLNSFSLRLGRIEDIIHDLQTVQKSSSRLARVLWTGTGLQLAYLNLLAQLKFSIHIPIGMDDLSYSRDCKAQVHIQGPTSVTPALLEETAQAAAPGYDWLRSVCGALHDLADAPPTPSSSGAVHPTTAHLRPPVHASENPEGPLPSLPMTQPPTREELSEQQASTLEHGLPIAAQEAADTAGELPINPERTPAHVQTSSEGAVVSGVASSALPFASAETLGQGANFPRAFSNPLYNQHTPGAPHAG
eukprot:jgi/Botrbrau1/18386/Bobra.0681s0001.1